MTHGAGDALSASGRETARARTRSDRASARRMPPLSRRESEVLTALAERLTNAEIAGRLYVSVRTVETYVSTLLRKFNAENRRELADIARRHSSASDGPKLRQLPPRLTTLVGRGEDVAAVNALLGSCRLVTLTGPAGVGKTRLAIEVAATIERRPDTLVAFVDLTSATDEATVLAAASAAMGVTSDGGRSVRDALLHLLSVAGRLMVVTDNCEHVLDAASQFLVEALTVNDRLKVLTTSREPLNVPGEHVHVVPPLGVQAAAELFWERASAVEPGLATAASSTEEAVRSICRRLDGLPLAVELAAAQVPVFTPQQIDARLSDRFALLRAPVRGRSERHAALQTALGWSYDLLEPPERILLDRLAVFHGRFGVEDVEHVATDLVVTPHAVPALLARLVRKSLVVSEPVGEERRYRMLESLREYASARLVDADEIVRWRERHFVWVMELLEQAGDGLNSDEQARWFATLDEQLANVQAGFEWGLRRPDDAARALAAAQGLRNYWMAGGIRRGNGLRWLQATADAATRVGPATRTRALVDAVLLLTLDDFQSARSLAEAARSIAADNARAAAYAALACAVVAVYGGVDGAETEARQAIAVLPPDDPLHWWARSMVALDLARRGRPADAAEQLRAAADGFRVLGDEHLADGALSYVADLALASGARETAKVDANRALTTARRYECSSCECQALIEVTLADDVSSPPDRLAHLQAALQLANGIGETWNILGGLDVIAAAFADVGRLSDAVTLAAASGALRAAGGLAPVLPVRGAERERAVTIAARSLDPALVSGLHVQGTNLDYVGAIDLALS